MPSGTIGWYETPTYNVEQTETGFITYGIPVSNDTINSPCGSPFPRHYLPRIYTLLEEYGAICADAGVVFPIGSLYRSLEYQHQCFNTGKYLHTVCRAMDVLPIPEWSVHRIATYAMMRRRMKVSRLGNLGIAPHWVHMEIAPKRQRATRQWRVTEAD